MKQLNFKADVMTQIFLKELVEKLHGAGSNKKSEIIRASIWKMALDELGEERIKEIILKSAGV